MKVYLSLLPLLVALLAVHVTAQTAATQPTAATSPTASPGTTQTTASPTTTTQQPPTVGGLTTGSTTQTTTAKPNSASAMGLSLDCLLLGYGAFYLLKSFIAN